MVTMRREEAGVILEIEQDVRGLKSLVIEVPMHDCRMTARREQSDGRPYWVEESTLGGQLVHTGSGTWRAVYDQIPERITSRSGKNPPVEVAAVVYQYIDGKGRVTKPRALAKRAGTLGRLSDDLARDYGAWAAVEALRTLAAAHGYRLEPDLELIAKLGDDCQAYHERAGAISDSLFGGGAPCIEDLFRGIAEAESLRQQIDETGKKG